jgi:hypothetical protein
MHIGILAAAAHAAANSSPFTIFCNPRYFSCYCVLYIYSMPTICSMSSYYFLG